MCAVQDVLLTQLTLLNEPRSPSIGGRILAVSGKCNVPDRRCPGPGACIEVTTCDDIISGWHSRQYVCHLSPRRLLSNPPPEQ